MNSLNFNYPVKCKSLLSTLFNHKSRGERKRKRESVCERERETESERMAIKQVLLWLDV